MRAPKPVSCFLLALLTFQTLGCQSFGPLKTDLPTTREAVDYDPVVKVTARDGEEWKLFYVSADSTSVMGQPKGTWFWEDQEVLEIPISEVSRLEEKHFSTSKTLILVGAIGGVVAIIANGLSNMTFFGGDPLSQ